MKIIDLNDPMRILGIFKVEKRYMEDAHEFPFYLRAYWICLELYACINPKFGYKFLNPWLEDAIIDNTKMIGNTWVEDQINISSQVLLIEEKHD